jgi:hypothetical protein
MIRIRWEDRAINEVFRRTGEKRSLWKKDELIGHLLRREGILKTIIERTIQGKNYKVRSILAYKL